MDKINSSKLRPIPKNVSLQCAKDELRQIILNIKCLENIKQELREGIDELSTENWNGKIDGAESTKLDIEEKLNKYDEQTVGSLKLLSRKRMRKRQRTLRRKSRMKSARKKVLLRRKELHKIIDRALEAKKLKIYKEKHMKEAANYAQLVLSNVTRKKADAQQYIQLFHSLKDLRKFRRTAATQNTDADSEYEFNTKINRLIGVWNDASEEYEAEENKLRLILSDVHKSSEEQWNEVLFGVRSENPTRLDTSNDKDFNKFLEIRRGWDSCIVPDNWQYGSYIPTGWVLPAKNPSTAWKIYRK